MLKLQLILTEQKFLRQQKKNMGLLLANANISEQELIAALLAKER